jgi:glyoxylase-like metal-dependent hydrolase (beta-lactamase superfamily II)
VARLFQIGTSRGGAVTQAGLRRVRFALACVLAWVVSSVPARECPGLRLQEVLPGISVVHGLWPSTDSGRAAHATTTVVLGLGRQVTVLDPGPTRQVGESLKRSLRCRHPTEVVALINTHAHAEQVLANAAFRVPVMATAGTVAAMQKRCPDCLAAMTEDLGSAALKGTRIVLPDRVLQDGQSLAIGGRAWQVRVMRHAHTESDLVLWSAAERIALVGGLVDGDRLPVLAQGRVLGWLQALDDLQALQPQWLVGQHAVSGPGQVDGALQRQRSYLCEVLRTAWQSMDAGLSEAEALQGLKLSPAWSVAQAELQEARRQQHQFNQLRAWREIEPIWMAQQAWPVPCGSAPDVGR